MNDFIADLETELVSAARRRATTRRRRLPRPRLAAVAAVAAVLVVALAAVAAVRGIDGTGSGDERSAAPPPSDPGVSVVLPAAFHAAGSPGCAQMGPGLEVSNVELSVFDRLQQAGDGLPGSLSWLPAAFVDAPSMRKTGADLRLIRAGVTPKPCTGETHVYQEGACVIAGTGPQAAARCFTAAQIASGAAVTVAGGTAYGIVPDGVQSVELSWDGGSAAASVQDNAYALQLDGPRAGDRVRVVPDGAAAGCTPSAAAYDAVPALRNAPEGTPPRALARAMDRLGSRGGWLPHARLATTAKGIDVWVAPDMPCDRAGTGPERVCLLPVQGGRHGTLLCDTPAALGRAGTFR